MRKLCLIIIIICTSAIEVLAQRNHIRVEPLPSLSLDDTVSFVTLNNVFLNTITNNIDVVGVGSTGFTLSEGIQFSNKLIQYLVLEKDFKTIALPRDDWGLRELNSYLTNGENVDSNEVREVIRKIFDQSAYYTEETFELLKWVKGYNNTHEHSPVRFRGISFIEPTPPSYLLSKYIMPIDSLTGIAIAKRRATSQNDSIAYVDISSWYNQKIKTIKEELTEGEYANLKMDIDNLLHLKEWSSRSDGAEKMNYFDSCLSITVSQLVAENNKIVLCGDNKMIAKTLIQTDVTRKGLGMLLHERLGKSYYAVLTDYYNKAEFYWLNSKSNKLEEVKSFSDKASTAYILHKKYEVKGGLMLYDYLVRSNISIFFNVHDLYDKRAKAVVQSNIPAFNTLTVFENENPVRFLKRGK